MLGGAARFQRQNILAAIASAYVQGMRYDDIRAGLLSFFPSPSLTPGRLNLIRAPNGARLLIDYARGANDQDFLNLLRGQTLNFYSRDENCPLSYEPSGEDFLSPCLAEADLVRRVLAPADYARWLRQWKHLSLRSMTSPCSPGMKVRRNRSHHWTRSKWRAGSL